MRTLFIILTLVLFSASVSAQSRYDFNKYNSIGYSGTVIALSTQAVYFGLKQHNIVYQRILTRRISLVGSFTASKYISRIDFEEGPDFRFYAKNQLGSNQQYTLYSVGEAVIKSNTFSIGIRNYMKLKGAIAPYGRFVEFKIGYTSLLNKSEDNKIVYNNVDDNAPYIGILPNSGLDHINIIGFQTGYGSSKPIIKNLFFDWQVSFNMNMPMWGNIPRPSIYYQPDDDVSFKDHYFLRNAYTVYRQTTRLRLNVGLHYGF